MTGGQTVKIYDSRPAHDALIARMHRDRVQGDVRTILREQETRSGTGRCLAATIGVLDAAGELSAIYRLRGDGKVWGAVRDGHASYMIPRAGQWRFATAEEVAALDASAIGDGVLTSQGVSV
jgi:hypothetical protein